MPALKGAGLLKGLGVTFKTMSRRSATAQYPHVRPDLPARTRGVIALVEEVCPFDALFWSPEFEYAEYSHEPLTHEKDRLREWAYTVPAPDPLEEGAVEPPELAAVRKAREAAAAKAAAAAGKPPATAAAPSAAPAGAGGAPAAGAAPARQPDVHVEPGIDQETFDRLVAAGESERTARAKAKAAYMRKAKAEARAKLAAEQNGGGA